MLLFKDMTFLPCRQERILLVLPIGKPVPPFLFKVSCAEPRLESCLLYHFYTLKARVVRNWLDALVDAVLETGVSILHSDCSHVVNCCPGSQAQKCLLFLFSHFGSRYRAEECLAQAQLHHKPSVANNRPSQNSPVMTKEF